eukprot:TRINITY_DN9357_c0_g3_i1.p1 TRINITY_DN9357_c0_g3~~TRINITY_DN9357_c0_g3_i1.p1  ORF type:complete len:217 (+),score=20.92 TRINITY_DN9357_c0_g3_i1:80-652(+)
MPGLKVKNVKLQEEADFENQHPENSLFNQYWYSKQTLETLKEEILYQNPKKVACLSTPSVHFSLPQGISWLLDYDESFSDSTKNYVKFDFNYPNLLPLDLMHSFDMVVIDPPFITEQVWTNYAQAAKMLICEGGKIIGSSIFENRQLLWDLMGISPCCFQPAIPTLVYQYDFFVNFEVKFMNEINQEIPQ